MWLAGRGRYREALETSSQLVGMLDPADHALAVATRRSPTGLPASHILRIRQTSRGRSGIRASTGGFRRAQSANIFIPVRFLGYELHLVLLPYAFDDSVRRKSMETNLIRYGNEELVHVVDDPPDIYLAAMYLQTGNWDRLRLFERDARNRPRSPVFLYMAHAPIAEYLRRNRSDRTSSRIC